MRLCYLVNQYPKVSHSFIRREILELESQGARVQRIALRGWEQRVVDQQDITEQGKTRYVLRAGAIRALLAVLRQSFGNPVGLLRAFSVSLSLCHGSDKSLLRHLICLVEACVAAPWIRAAGTTHIHAHFGTNSTEVALMTSLLTGVPYSFTVHGPEEFDHPEGLRLRQKMRHAAGIVAISSYGRSQLFRWAAIDDWHKIAVVRCGLDTEFLGESSTAAQRAPSTFVCVGRLCEQKGQLLLVNALRRVLDLGHDCHVVLAGDGEMRTQIERHAKALGLDGHITITGWIDSARVRHEILAARALLLPSFAEGLPVVLMEALALSRPVITTYVAGIPELVENGSCGWLVPAGDTTALADAMISCLQCSEEVLSDMGRNGRRRVMARHDIRNSVAQLLKIFSPAAAGK